MKSQLRWVGHVARMEDHRLPKIILYGELSSGQRNIGGPKKRYKDSLKKSLRACHIDQHQWSTLALDRASWRHTIDGAVSTFEKNRCAEKEEKRRKRKNRIADQVQSTEQSFPCSSCGRACRSKAGLISHQRACSRRGHPPP